MPESTAHLWLSERCPSRTRPWSSKTTALTPGSHSSWWPAEALIVLMKAGVAMGSTLTGCFGRLRRRRRAVDGCTATAPRAPGPDPGPDRPAEPARGDQHQRHFGQDAHPGRGRLGGTQRDLLDQVGGHEHAGLPGDP